MLIDRWMPIYDVSERDERGVPASTRDAYDAVKKMDLARSLPIKGLLLVRGIPHFLTGRPLPKAWVLVGPFSSLIRREMLRLVEEELRQEG